MSLAKQMRHRDKEMVPKILVQGMFALMFSSLALVAFAQWSGAPQQGVLVEAPVVQSLDIVMTGDRQGTYQVYDTNGALLATSTEDKAGFIGVLGRSIERERSVRSLPLDAPMQVVRRDNGHIAVLDGSTDSVYELIGYGADNVAAFANLLN
ncbi:photosynthetic complex assembly protein PuhC [Yoonia sediminilitoris]|uniref:Putative photosynthetic complex assembly protein n=1 Tax=Yoonia sediminilitoris TaxID=1286148 RepID=A0A2T6KMH5_9RHOB|nr:photosynthetic complex assembly protein PuhC [Yoonia sediminilitoris]PUB17422.1 putative photosynthetic complex assembly protein [Yoonia sediminilitoris]RCW97717.1 putative photosynthetic complex assembly protein [Yoonia sediminilitoris]